MFNKYKKWSLLVFALIAALPVFAQDTAETKVDIWGPILFWSLIIVLLGQILAVLGRIFKLYELSSEVAGNKKVIPWNYINALLFAIFLVVGIYGSFWSFENHGSMILPESASEHGLLTDSLMMTTFYITLVVFIVTHILLFGYSFIYRKKEGKRGYYYPHNDRLEVYWTTAPAIVLTILVVFGWRTWTDITSPERQPENPIVVEVTAEQFKWNIRYPGEDNKLGPKNYQSIGGVNVLGVDFDDPTSHDDFMPSEIVLPVNQPVQLVMGAKDVLHSAYMPHFRVQMNCVPGMPTYFNFTPRTTTAEMRKKLNDEKFDYVLLCAKICGNAHYNMQYKVRIVSELEYAQWLEAQKPTYNEEFKLQLVADREEQLKNKQIVQLSGNY